MLTVRNLHVQYGAFSALQDVSLTIPDGQVVSIVGANGAGKTTLINTISGLLRPAGGAIEFDGTDLYALDQRALRAMRRKQLYVVLPRRARLRWYLKRLAPQAFLRGVSRHIYRAP